MNQRSGNILVIILAVLLFVSASTVAYFFWQSQNKEVVKEQPKTYEQQSQGSFTQPNQSGSFFTSLPKTIDVLSLKDLPSYSNLSQASIYQNNTWFTGGGNIIQYDVDQKKIIRYSNPSLGNCYGRPVEV